MNDESNRTERDGTRGPFIAVAIAVLLVFIVASLYSQAFVESISFPDFVRLVKASRKDPKTGRVADDAEGKIQVERDGKTYQYLDLSAVTIGERHILGKVTIRALDKDGKEEERIRKEVTFRTSVLEHSSNEAQKVLSENNIDFGIESAPNAVMSYVILPLAFLAIAAALIFLLGRRILGIGSPMSFGRSRARLHAMEDLNITFNDVAGIDEAVEEVREVVDFLRNAERYQQLGGRIPKGVLLVGPPGTGKTLLAKAIAGEAGVPFFSLSGSDFVEMFVGVGAARVRDMFQQAETKAPCIVFIDELDALGKSRSSTSIGGHDEREQTLNALLVEMDGFVSNSGVIVMAATNRPETLDQALLRPGRFDRHVLVDHPDIRGREAILKVHVKSVKLDETVDLKQVAAITTGFVGADLAHLVNEAALLAARREKKAVGMTEFNEGVERVIGGLEKRNRVMSDDEKQRIAYHEAGHALVAYSLPNTDPVHKVTIVSRGMALGYVMQRPEGDRNMSTQSELESKIQVALAGTLAEEIVLGDVGTGATSDLEKATKIARRMVMAYGMSSLGRVNYRESNPSLFLSGGDADRGMSHSQQTAREIDLEVKRIIDDSLAKTRHILETRREALNAITKRLLEVETMDGESLKAIVEANIRGPLVVPGTSPSPRPSSERVSEGIGTDRTGIG